MKRSYVFVPAKGFEDTHDVSTCGRRVRSRASGRDLKVTRDGRALMYDASGASRWVRLRCLMTGTDSEETRIEFQSETHDDALSSRKASSSKVLLLLLAVLVACCCIIVNVQPSSTFNQRILRSAPPPTFTSLYVDPTVRALLDAAGRLRGRFEVIDRMHGFAKRWIEARG